MCSYSLLVLGADRRNEAGEKLFKCVQGAGNCLLGKVHLGLARRTEQ